MNGLELSEKYYNEYGKPMLENEFSELMPYIAIGFVGSGSDRYGFDDEISRDHDYEPGFCIFIPDENVVSRRQAFLLERAYSKLPNEFYGIKRQKISPVGGNRNSVILSSDFYTRVVGSPNGELSINQWLHIPDYALSEAVNGKVFFDEYGEFSKIRQKIKDMPIDIKLKRIAGNLLIMAQSGSYNFPRCIKHGENEAAQLSLNEYINAVMKITFLLNNTYMPYYKWSFRALRKIEGTDCIVDNLRLLLFDYNTKETINNKFNAVEAINNTIFNKLKVDNYINIDIADLEKCAYEINNKIADNNIRNMHILEAI